MRESFTNADGFAPSSEAWVLDGIGEYSRLLASSKPLVEKWLPDMQRSLESEQSQLGTSKIRITVFGTQKAGKSTLCNALLGERIAKVGVPPVTDRVTEYDYKGAFLVDTPGTQAREEETIRAFEAVAVSNLLLVVVGYGVGKVSQTSVWDPLVKALDEAGNRRIPLIFILHDLEARLLDRNSSERDSLTRVITEIEKLATKRKLDFRVLVCNGKEYLDKTLAGVADDEFLEKTGIPNLERTLEHILAKSDSVLRITKPLRSYTRAMRSVEHSIETDMAKNSEAAARLAIQIEAVESAKKATYQELSKAIGGWRDSLISSVSESIDTGQTVDEESLRKLGETHWDSESKRLETRLKVRMDELGKTWSVLDDIDQANLSRVAGSMGIPPELFKAVGIGSAVISIKPIGSLLGNIVTKLGLSSAIKKAATFVIPGLSIVGIVWIVVDIFRELLGGGRSSSEIADERSSLKKQVRESIEQTEREMRFKLMENLESHFASEIEKIRAENDSSKAQIALETDLVSARRYRSIAESVLSMLVKGFAEEAYSDPAVAPES
jgi:hypothetical protein